jgi:hypothetical protein
VRGASLVVHAVRDARKAAAAMHRFISAKVEREAEQTASNSEASLQPVGST